MILSEHKVWPQVSPDSNTLSDLTEPGYHGKYHTNVLLSSLISGTIPAQAGLSYFFADQKKKIVQVRVDGV